MASADSIEGGLTEGAGALLTVIVVGIVVLLFLSWRKISLPVGAYPYSLWGSLSSGIDSLFYATPLRGGKTQQTVDHVLGGVSTWLLDNTPNPTKSPNWAAYSDAVPAADGSIQVDTGS